MQVTTSGVQGDTTTPATQTQSQPRAEEQKNQFLQLLVAQIKGQNPLNPMEGSEFVSQLAQFSSLEELTKIRGALDNVQDLLATQKESIESKEQTPWA